MNAWQNICDDLACCFEYPGADTGRAARRLEEVIGGAAGELADWLDSVSRGAAEERYTVLFDLKAVCCLHAGYQIYGETYPRGTLLSELAAELHRAGLTHERDLPDYLPTLLRLLGRLTDAEDQSLLVHAILLPAIDKMNAQLARSPGPYGSLMKALHGYLAEGVAEPPEPVVLAQVESVRDYDFGRNGVPSCSM